MEQTTVALKYARALFMESLERDRLDAVAGDMSALADLEREDPSFHAFLLSPEVLTEHKMAFIQAVFGSRLDPLTVNFLKLLVEKGRIDLLPEIARDVQRLVEEHRGMLRAEVLSAVPLPREHQERLKRQLDRLTGKNVVLESRTDASVLGGVIVHLGNQILDGSLRQGLKGLRERLLHAEVN
jgi:F-type H+-transporting ATPase subunit delta